MAECKTIGELVCSYFRMNYYSFIFTCRECGKQFKRGFFADSHTGNPIGTTLNDMLCPDCEKAREERLLAESIELNRAQMIRRSLLVSGVPVSIISSRFSSFKAEDPSEKAAYDAAIKFVHSGSMKILVLLGSNGRGKSHLSVSCLADIAERDFLKEYKHPLRYCTRSDINDLFKKTYSGLNNRTEGDVLNEMSQEGLLVIDEIGQDVGSDYLQKKWQELIQRRLENLNCKTVLAGSIRMADLSDFVGPAVFSRMQELDEHGNSVSSVIELSGRDHRKDMRTSCEHSSYWL